MRISSAASMSLAILDPITAAFSMDRRTSFVYVVVAFSATLSKVSHLLFQANRNCLEVPLNFSTFIVANSCRKLAMSSCASAESMYLAFKAIMAPLPSMAFCRRIALASETLILLISTVYKNWVCAVSSSRCSLVHRDVSSDSLKQSAMPCIVPIAMTCSRQWANVFVSVISGYESGSFLIPYRNDSAAERVDSVDTTLAAPKDDMRPLLRPEVLGNPKETRRTARRYSAKSSTPTAMSCWYVNVPFASSVSCSI